MFHLGAASDKPSRVLTLWSSRMRSFSAYQDQEHMSFTASDNCEVDSKKCGE